MTRTFHHSRTFGVLLLLLLLCDSALVADAQSNDAIKLYNQALAQKNNKAFDEALRLYTKAIEISPDFFEAYFARGLLYLNDENDPKNAIADFTKAMSLKPDSDKPYIARGVAYARQDELDLALKDFDKVLELIPTHIGALMNRGRIYFSKGEYAKAIADLKRVVDFKPDDFDSLGLLTISQLDVGNFSDAIINLHKLIELQPNNIPIRLSLALTYARNNEIENSKREFEAALKQAQPAEIRECLAEAESVLKKKPDSDALKQAVKLLQAALQSK